MSDTIRELNIQAVMARLAAITTGNGYVTDIGANVLRARKPVDPDELPACAVFPQPDQDVVNANGFTYCTMPVRVEAMVQFGDENPSEVAERIHGDMIKCLAGRDWARSPDYIDSIAYAGGGVEEYPDGGHVIVGTAVLFFLKYNFMLGDPCTNE